MPAQLVVRGRGWTMVLGEAATWLRSARAHSFDALIADPPYSSGGLHARDRRQDPATKYSKRTSSRLRLVPNFDGDNRDQRSYAFWSTVWMTSALRALRPGAPACVWTDWRQLPTTTDAFQAAGFTWRGVAVWSKASASRPTPGRFRNDAEFVVWGSVGAMPFDRGVAPLPGSWQCAPVSAVRRRHVTEKPLSVMSGIVEIVPRGSIVLDPFAGSATTGVACIESGRRFVGIEQSPEIFRDAVERLREAETRTRRAAA